MSDMIEAGQLPFLVNDRNGIAGTQTAAPSPAPAPKTLDELEREHILRVLNESNGNRERAAAILGISTRTLYRKLREYETDRRSETLATDG
jgi:DNA-binding NtrC family response regulator